MQLRPTFRTVATTLGVALLVAVLIVWLVAREAGRQTEAAARASQARAALAAVDELSADLARADAHRCAYVVRVDATRRDAFRDAKDGAGRQLQRLQDLMTGDLALPSRLGGLVDLVGRKLTLLDRSLRLRDEARFNDRGQLALTRQLQELNEELGRALADVRAAADQALDRQTQLARSSARQAGAVVGVGNLVLVVFLGLSAAVAAWDVAVRGRARVAEAEAAARRDGEQSTRLAQAQTNVAELQGLRGHLEEQLRHAQRLASVGRVTSGVAHDFNNLLTLILGCSEASLRSLPEDDPSRSFITEVVKAGRRAADLTRQLLGAGRGGELAPLDLNAVVADIEPLLRRLAGRSVELVTNPAAGLRPVLADRGRLDQVLLNLVANARDALPEGGRVTIETGLDGAFAILGVTDNGCGMTEEVRARLFEPFFTTKDAGKGTGLGMAIVQDAVRVCGGRLEVDSAPGRGTAVRVYLPLAGA